MNFALNKADNQKEYIEILLQSNSIEQLKKLGEKKLYLCPYCKVPMTVKGGKERDSHFSHPRNLSCAESTRVEGNYSKYKKQIKNDSPRRQLLVSMIRDELEVSAKIHDTIQVLDGYRLQGLDKYFPDVYVKTGSKEWAITVLANMTEKESAEHSKVFKKKSDYFKEKNLIPLWFIDKSNLATENQKNSIVFFHVESLASQISKEDRVWRRDIESYTDKKELFKVMNYPSRVASQRDVMEVKSLFYISQIDERNFIRVHRYVSDLADETLAYRGLLIGETSRLSFSEALQIEGESFLLKNSSHEEENREQFKQRFLTAKKEHEEDEEKRQRKVSRRSIELPDFSKYEHLKSEEETFELHTPEPKKADVYPLFGAVEFRSNTKSGKARELDEFLRTTIYPELNKQKVHNLKEHVPHEKYEKFVEKMLTMRIEGAAFIKTSNQEWRSLMLKWLEENYRLDEWTVSISEMLKLLIEHRIEFIQNSEVLLKVPIQNFLHIYFRELSKDMKVKCNHIITD